jgi:thioredoxin-related protein
MFRYIVFAFILLPQLVLAEAPDGYPFQSFDKAMKQANAEARLLFVYFGRYGCGYCDKTNKEAFSDAEVKQRYSENYVLAYVDSESGKRMSLPSGERITERELGTRYDAFVTPVFSFMSPDGNVVYRLIGVQSKDDLINADMKVQDALAKLGAS